MNLAKLGLDNGNQEYQKKVHNLKALKMFRALVTLIISLFAVYISGCGQDKNESQEEITANFLQVTPSIGSEVGSEDSIILTFDSVPTGITSTAGTATVSGKTVVIHGPFDPGFLNFTVTWVGGRKRLNFIRPL